MLEARPRFSFPRRAAKQGRLSMILNRSPHPLNPRNLLSPCAPCRAVRSVGRCRAVRSGLDSRPCALVGRAL
jgi:hypothetical protein